MDTINLRSEKDLLGIQVFFGLHYFVFCALGGLGLKFANLGAHIVALFKMPSLCSPIQISHPTNLLSKQTLQLADMFLSEFSPCSFASLAFQQLCQYNMVKCLPE